MRDYTNLAWPEGPFGADQRPFGRRERILMAVALELDARGAVAMPIAVTTVYLRVHRTQALDVQSDTLNMGFRSTVAEGQSDEVALLELIDRALIRGRRHAAVLAGHGLDRDLARLPRLADRRLPGVIAVGDAWAARQMRQRGTALMVDTQWDVHDGTAHVDVTLTPMCRDQLDEKPDLLAARSLVRCITIGLVAAAHVGAYRWNDCFAVCQAAEAAAWDRMEGVDWTGLSPYELRMGGSM